MSRYSQPLDCFDLMSADELCMAWADHLAVKQPNHSYTVTYRGGGWAVVVSPTNRMNVRISRIRFALRREARRHAAKA